MLAQKLANSLPTIRPLTYSWVPTPGRNNMLAWWQKDTGVTSAGAPTYVVSQWDDQSGNANHFTQTTIANMPTAAGNVGQNNGEIWFDGGNSQYLDIPQMSVAGDFSIGMRFKIFTVGGGVMFADRSQAHEFTRITSTTQLRIKVDSPSGALNIPLDSGTWNDGNPHSLVITRTSGVINVWVDEVVLTTTGTRTDDFEIDCFGVRQGTGVGINPFDGWLMDASIYNEANAQLTVDLNHYYANTIA